MLKYTELKDTNRCNLRDIIPLSKPFTLVVEPSSLCNFKCKMCFQSTGDSAYFLHNKRNMEFMLFEEIIRSITAWGGEPLKVLKLSLYGEPLINKDFCRMLALAKQSHIAERIETTTNASLLTPEICEGMVLGGLDYMRVSIYSPLAAKHKEITGSQITPQEIHVNLVMLQETKARLSSKTPFVAVKMLDAYSDENDVFRKMYSDVADEIYLDKPHNWVGSREKNFISELYEGTADKANADNKENFNDVKACSVSFYTLSVRNNGDVAPCCVDYAGGTNIGNITKTPLKDLWQGEALRKFWSMQLLGKNYMNPSCGNCELYKSSYYTKDNVDGVPVERL
jgi:radical SAM protein with 4Fe4S-binding SPASM domain